ncbi:ArnT family glycosyltransferase [Salidesulfovibrio brasiliensis]|uniref:ArnT family glycosyltransferase n=1 Tax=Salidesulfovibrio brasiliensis TaxID=221711 RepID=UPI0006D0DCFF|nr:glycosyltransferase family 39 protein [Salidesulfovibrio brasiliensis]
MNISQSFRTRPDIWAAVLIIVTFAIRLWFVATGQLNLVQDESQYWDWTRHLQLTYYSKGPLIAWIIHTWTSVFGDTELGVRFGSILGMALTQIVLYIGISRLFLRPGIALLTLFITATMPLFMALGILMTTDNSFVFLWTSAMFSLYAASLPEGNLPPVHSRVRTWPFIPIALCFGIGILAKYTMLGFAGLAVVYGILLHWRRMLPSGFWPRLFLALSAGIVIGFLPTFIWNLQNDFVGYKHVFYLIGVSGKKASQLIRFDRFPDYIGSQFGLATPWWMIFALIGGGSAFFRYFDQKPAIVDSETPRMNVRQATLLAVFFWPMWLFFLLWSFHAKVMPNWTTVAYVSGSILAAYAFAGFSRKQGKAKVVRNSVVGVSIFFYVLINMAPHLPIPAEINITNRLKGWTELGHKIEEIKSTSFEDPDKVFIFSDLYDMTAATAFYSPGQPRTYCAWIHDRRMNQYDLWPGPQDKVGWDAIMVRKHEYGNPHKEVVKMFESVSDPIVFTATYNGQPTRTFTLYICRNYNGYWPSREGKF